MGWAAEGDRRAFDQITLRHGRLALRLARRLVTDAAVAEDLAQEAMVRAWRHAGRFDPERAAFGTWLYRIVANLCIDQNRRRIHDPLPEGFDPPDPGPGAEEHVDTQRHRLALAGAVAALPQRQRAALTLVYEEGLSGAETGRVLGISAKAVERLLARARALLRDTLSPLRVADENEGEGR